MVLYEGIPPCRCGGIGRRTGLKIPRRKSYGFDPRHRYHVQKEQTPFRFRLAAKTALCSLLLPFQIEPASLGFDLVAVKSKDTVPFPPCGENCTMFAPSSLPNRTRSAGLRFGSRFFDNSTKFQKWEVSDLDRIKELGRYQMILLLLMAVMILAFTVTYPIVTARSGFLYEDTILVPSEEDGCTVYSGNRYGTAATFTVSAGTNRHLSVWQHRLRPLYRQRGSHRHSEGQQPANTDDRH